MFDLGLLIIIIVLFLVLAGCVALWLYNRRHKRKVDKLVYIVPIVIIFVIAAVIVQKTTWDLSNSKSIGERHHLQQLEDKWKIIEQHLTQLKGYAKVADVQDPQARPFYFAGEGTIIPTAFNAKVDSLKESFYSNDGNVINTFSSVDFDVAVVDGIASSTLISFNYAETLKYYPRFASQLQRIDELISSTNHRFAAEQRSILIIGILLNIVVFSLLLLLWAIMHKSYAEEVNE